MTVTQLLDVARSQLGYKEKATNAYLDDFTANAGSNNYTKYARDLYAAGYYGGTNLQGGAWCDMFTDWCFLQAAGGDAKEAQRVECQTGNYGATVGYSANYYEAQGRLDTSPKAGDQVFFRQSTIKWAHTGIVESYNPTTQLLTTIEGNSNNQVCRNYYYLNKTYKQYPCCYGHPYYDEEEEDDDMTQDKFNEMYANMVAARRAKEGSDWSEADRKWAEKEGMLNGSDGKMMWLDSLTREQLAAILHRFWKKYIDTDA